ncbi:hypothetical protein [Bradyrhizobium sp. USDA 4486]
MVLITPIRSAVAEKGPSVKMAAETGDPLAMSCLGELTASYPFRQLTRPRCERFFCCLPNEQAAPHCALQLSFALPNTILSLRSRRIIGAMASDSMFSHNNAPLKMVRAFWPTSAKSSLYSDRCHSERCYGCRGYGFGRLVQDVVCFKRDNSTACNYVLQENRHRFVIKTLNRNWHAGCLKM